MARLTLPRLHMRARRHLSASKDLVEREYIEPTRLAVSFAVIKPIVRISKEHYRELACNTRGH